MRIRLAVPNDANRDEKEAVLNSALEAVTLANEGLIARGLPTFVQGLKSRGIRWRPEPPGDEHFDLGSTVLKRGWGDCDDLAPWHAASLRQRGTDPEARAVVRPSGPGRWHAIVQRSNGSIEDPSRAAGMGVVGGDVYRGPFWPSMFGDRLALAATPLQYGYGGRVDVPAMSVPAAYSMLARAASPRDAVRGACAGALSVCGEDADELDMLRLAGMHDLLSGAAPEDVDDALAELGAVGFLPALLPAAASIAAPLASKALSAFGGGGGGGGGKGAPAAPSPGGGPSPGATMSVPSPAGPIIITRF